MNRCTNSSTVRRFLIAFAALFPVSALVVPAGFAQSADNSSQNFHSTTADIHATANSDRMTTAQIRRALIADKSLSLGAHNIRIIVQNGSITLKGSVKSEEEKQKVLADASSAAGSGSLTDQLTIKP